MNKRKIKIGIIDLGSNNIYSICNALKLQGYNITILKKKFNYKLYDAIILPGVGSFNYAMNKIINNKLIEPIQKFSSIKNRLLFGICLGMQLFFEQSEEFVNTEGLAILSGKVKMLPKNKNNIIPNMGWHNLEIQHKNILLNNVKINSKFYFVHSYYCLPKNKKIISSYSKFYSFKYCSSIMSNNIFGTQFHPEKSSIYGLRILSNINKFFK